MNEKVYTTMKRTGTANITIGILTIVAGVTAGILLIIGGGRLLVEKSRILF